MTNKTAREAGPHESDIAVIRLHRDVAKAVAALAAKRSRQALNAPWKAGDPCAACGSTHTYWSTVGGAQCLSCGRGDDDE